MEARWGSFQLVPDDVLFFRDGKPSTIGADHYLRSLFPPFPSTVYGAIRTRRLLDKGVDLAGLKRQEWSCLSEELRSELGEWGKFGTLELRGPWIVKNGVPMLPAPADLALVLGDDCERAKSGAPGSPRWAQVLDVIRYRTVEDNELPRAWSHGLVLATPYVSDGTSWIEYSAERHRGREPTSVDGWFLNPEGFAAWSRGDLPRREHFVHHTELWRPEPRTGVGLQKGARAADAANGKLYTFGYVRMDLDDGGDGVAALGFEVRGAELGPRGYLRLGGDGRTARLAPGPRLAVEPPPAPLGGRFLLYFATPALSEGGAFPPGFSAGRLNGDLGGAPCKLSAAFVHGPQLIGGWDMAAGNPKPLRRAIPAGSVFAFQIAAEADPGALTSIHGKNLSDFDNEALARQGFGLALVGAQD